jgi:hypothetical protein
MSIEVDNLRVTKLRTYLVGVIERIKENYNEFNIDFLSNEADNYSLDKIPTDSTVETWITGDILHRDVFNFKSRMNYSADTISNIENIGFYEIFEKIIEENNKNKDLPEINGIQSITCLNCGTLNNANTNTAEFDIQIQIEYMEKGGTI